MIKIILFIAVVICLPVTAYADGGGPLLLIINGLAFLYGGIIIVLVEWLIYILWAKIPKRDAFFDALTANLISTVLIGFGVPFLVAALSFGVGAILPTTISAYALALGTWAYEGVIFPNVMFASTFFWWVVTFFLTVYVEKKVLQHRWKSRQFVAAKSARSLSWVSNTITYLGLLAVIGGFIILKK